MSRVSVVLTLFLVCCTTIYGAVDESLCEWHYKCEDVLQSDPFICGRFAEYPVKVCPTAVTLPDVQKDGSAIEATTAEPVSANTFNIIRAPCLYPYREDRHGECRIPF